MAFGASMKDKAILAIGGMTLLYAASGFLWFKALTDKASDWNKSQRAYTESVKKYQNERALIAKRAFWEDSYEEEREKMPMFPEGEKVGEHWLERMDEIANKNHMAISTRAAGKEEEVVGEAVDVFEDFFGDGVLAVEGPEAAFGAAADGPGQLQPCGQRSAAGQQEMQSRTGVLAQCIHRGLACGHKVFGQGIGVLVAFGRRGRHEAHHGHQVFLDVVEDGVERGAGAHRADDADLAVEFVEVAVGFDTDVVFGHPGTAVDTGGPGVARPGIDSVHGEDQCWIAIRRIYFRTRSHHTGSPGYW